MTAELNKEKFEVNDGLDSIVIVNDLGDIPGGRAIDTSRLAEDVTVIKSGHILVKEDASGNVAALGVSDGNYETLPEGYSYLGVLKATVLKKDPRGAILTIGQVNAAASPYPVTETIRKGLPMIQFLYGNNA